MIDPSINSDVNREMSFLHKLSDIIEKGFEKESDILSSVAKIVPKVLCLSDNVICTIECPWGLMSSHEEKGADVVFKSDIRNKGKKVGTLALISRHGKNSEIPPNEKELLLYTSERLGRVLERYEAQRNERDRYEELETQQRELENKNIALREMLHLMNREKKEWISNQAEIINSVILPLLTKLEDNVGNNMHLELIKLNIRNMLDGGETEQVDNFMKLSQREMEICYLLKSGMTSKEIGAKLALSSMTVDRHRNSIRKKLDLIGTGKNLITVLKMIDSR